MNEPVALLILLILSGVFSGSETALVTISLGRAEGLAKEGRSGGTGTRQHSTPASNVALVSDADGGSFSTSA